MNSGMKVLYIFIFFLLIPRAYPQDSSSVKNKLLIGGYIKNLQELNFNKDFQSLVSGNLLHNRLNLKWKSTDRITAVSEFRTRLFWGEKVKLIPEFVSLLRNENEKLNMQKAWISNESLILHTNVERLYLDYQERDLNVRIGRQRINWGITTTWNPNDIFNAYNFLDFDYEERPGVDGGKVQHIFDNSSTAEFAYAFTGKKGSVAALKYSINKWDYDMQLIGGWYRKHPTAGLGWAGYVKDAGFKGEAQYYFAVQDSASRFNFALEGDYMFKSGWYVNAAFMLNDKGLSRPVNNWSMLNLKLSPENLMPTKWNFMLTAAKEFTPLFSANGSVLYAPGTNLLIVIPSFQYNMAPNLDLNLLEQSFISEMDGNFEAVNHQLFLRIKWSF